MTNLASELDVRDLIERVIYITLNLLDWYFIFRTAEFIPSFRDIWEYGDYYVWSSTRFGGQPKKIVEQYPKNSSKNH